MNPDDDATIRSDALPADDAPTVIGGPTRPSPDDADATHVVDSADRRAVDAQSIHDLGDRRDPLIGRHLGHFKILTLIGSGGMGSVYEAEQDQPRRRVALKVMRFGVGDESAFRRFAREVELLGRLQHPTIAQVFEAGIADANGEPVPFFTMEFVEGKPLSAHVRDAGLGATAVLELVARVADGIEHAHARGVVHRDLKPGNILVDKTGAPKIIDFGLARGDDPNAQVSMPETQLGQVLGTIPYMSPEQFAGDTRGVDQRSDVYALGVILFEALTGQLPLDVRKKNLAEAARIVTVEEPSQIGSIRRELKGDVETIVQKALEKDKTRRYPTAAALAEDIRRFLRDEPISARPASAFYQLEKFARRNKALVLGVLATFVALLLGIVGTTVGMLRATGAKNDALAAEAAEARLRIEASARADEAKFQAYVARIGAADAALGLNDVLLAEERLAACDPTDRRFEWRYLAAHLDRSAERILDTPVGAIAIDRAGKRLATVRNGALLVLDLQTHAVTEIAPTASPWTAGLAWSPSGEEIAVTNVFDRTTSLFDVAARTIKRTFSGHVGEVDSVAFAPFGTYVATGSKDGTIRVFDVESAELLTAVRGVAVNAALAYSPDGRFLLTTGTGGAKVFMTSDYSLYTDLEKPDAPYGAGALSPNGEFFAMASADGTVTIFDSYRGTEMRVLRGNRAAIEALDWSGDGAFVAAATRERVVYLFDAATGLESAVLRGNRLAIKGLAFDPARPASLYTGGEDGVRRFDVRVPDGDVERSEHYADCWAPVASADGSRVLTTGRDGTTRLWTGDDLTPLGPLFGAHAPGAMKALDRTGSRAAISTKAGPIEIFDLTRFEKIGACGAFDAEPAALAFSNDGRALLALTKMTGELITYDVKTFQETGRRAPLGPIAAAVFGTDARTLAFAGKDSVIVVRDLAGTAPDVRLGGGAEPIGAIAVSENGRVLLADGLSRTDRRFYALPSGKLLSRLPEERGAIHACALSPDGERAVFGCEDGTIKIADPLRGAEVGRLRMAPQWIEGLAFLANGRDLLATTSSGKVRLFTTRPYDRRLNEELAKREAEADPAPAATSIVALSRTRRPLGDANGLFDRCWRIVREPSALAEDLERSAATLGTLIYGGQKSGRFALALGAATYREGKFNAALALLDQASYRLTAAEDPDYRPAIVGFRAMALWKAGKADEAKRMLAALEQIISERAATDDDEARRILAETKSLIEKGTGDDDHREKR